MPVMGDKITLVRSQSVTGNGTFTASPVKMPPYTGGLLVVEFSIDSYATDGSHDLQIDNGSSREFTANYFDTDVIAIAGLSSATSSRTVVANTVGLLPWFRANIVTTSIISGNATISAYIWFQPLK